MANTIILKSVGTVFQKEAPAAAAIKPGHFLERATDGDFQVQSTANAETAKIVALTDKNKGTLITDAYAADDRVYAAIATPGMEINALVPAGASPIVIGDKLSFNGDGCLVKATALDEFTSALTATASGTISDVTDISISTTTGNTYEDTAVNDAVNTAIGEVNNRLAELADVIATAITRTGAVVATAIEAVNNSGGGTETRIQVEMV